MNNTLPAQPGVTPHELALISGDLSKLTPAERLSLYKRTCESLDLNPLTCPFNYIAFRNGALKLYATKDCAEQLRSNKGISITSMETKTDAGCFIVIVKGQDKAGRTDFATGAVPISGLSGENLSNAIMKAETKAKRRFTLSISGLGLLDESETGSIDGAKTFTAEAVHTESSPLNLGIKTADEVAAEQPAAPGYVYQYKMDYNTSQNLKPRQYNATWNKPAGVWESTKRIPELEQYLENNPDVPEPNEPMRSNEQDEIPNF